MLSPERQAKLDKIRQLAEHYNVKGIIDFLWDETSSKFCVKISKYDYCDVRLTPTSCSMFIFRPIPSGFVQLGINPLSLAKISQKLESDCLSFIKKLELILQAEMYLKPKYPDWHYYNISTLEQASIFLENINNFLN